MRYLDSNPSAPTPLDPATTPIRFLHIPKCAGAIVNETIVQWYRPEEVIWFPTPKEWILCEEDLSTYKCVVGHGGFEASHFDIGRARWRIASIFRDPVDRFLSNYFFHRAIASNVGERDYLAAGDDPVRNLEEVLDHPNLPVFGLLNIQTWMMSCRTALESIGLFGPLLQPIESLDDLRVPQPSPGQQAHIFECALKHLSQIHVIGTFEHIDKFFEGLSDVLRKPLQRPDRHYNASRKDDYFAPSHPDYHRLSRKVRERNYWDVQLYEAACLRFR
jgi:hypothetical protein